MYKQKSKHQPQLQLHIYISTVLVTNPSPYFRQNSKINDVQHRSCLESPINSDCTYYDNPERMIKLHYDIRSCK